MTGTFENKVVIITGGSTGIGRAAAERFGKEGAKVVLAARSADKLRATVVGLAQQGIRAFARPTDVGQINQCKGLIDDVVRDHGRIDVLVNSAGRNDRGPVDHVDAEVLGATVDVNLRAPMVLSRLALPYLHRSEHGAIVNVASIAGRLPLEEEAAYSATKFGLRIFSLAMAQETKGSSVSVSVVSPGPVDTGFIMEDIDSVPDIVFSQPMSTAEEIAELVYQCAIDGKNERAWPSSSARLATAGYLFPKLRAWVVPALERKGRRIKQQYFARAAAALKS
jgi:short-subunit dehydrogenase